MTRPERGGRRMNRWLRGLLLLFLVTGSGLPVADEIRVAVASNFAEAARRLATAFEAESGHRVTLVIGATGKLYAQIHHGAPFDAYLAADRRRPERLEREGLARPGSRFTYALGELVLWSPRPGYVDPEGRVLEAGEFRHLAIANPRLAPYGRAAREVLEALGLWQRLQGRMVRGENIGQAFQFVRSGNAELGFVARSQLGGAEAGSRWPVPSDLHAPIVQQAVLLKEKPAARAFLAFLRGRRGRAIITDQGYRLP